MKKLIWSLIIVLLAIILFAPIFSRPLSKPNCICNIAGPCPCNTQFVSLWEIIKNKMVK